MTAAATARRAALGASLRAQHRPVQLVTPPPLVCRVWPEHTNLALEDREASRRPSDTVNAVAALWCYLSGESPSAPSTLQRERNLATITKDSPNGTLWAILPAVFKSWTVFKGYSESVYPPPSSSPDLGSVARAFPFGWWLTLDGVSRYRPALQAGLRPGGPATRIHSEAGIGGAGELFNLDLAIDRYTRRGSDKKQFIRFLEYHNWKWEIASVEWERACNALPPDLSAESVDEIRQGVAAISRLTATASP